MSAIPKIPETPAEYQAIVDYLQSKTIPATIQYSTVKSNFERCCKKFEIDENGFLYTTAIFKEGEMISEKHHVVPRYDNELRSLLLKNFHDQHNHRNYHKTFSALSEKHIGIMQTEVQAYVN
ncbi:12771_t:CDS:1, partial [Cetraspora pellucida]